MKNALKIIGGLLVAIGIVWVLQGLNILPGSFMTGNLFWAWLGAIAIVIGGALLAFGLRRPPPKR
jgi:hypothetical protein